MPPIEPKPARPEKDQTGIRIETMVKVDYWLKIPVDHSVKGTFRGLVDVSGEYGPRQVGMLEDNDGLTYGLPSHGTLISALSLAEIGRPIEIINRGKPEGKRYFLYEVFLLDE